MDFEGPCDGPAMSSLLTGFRVGLKIRVFVEYQAHMDNLDEEVPRIATVIVYLSDVEAGGETVFPSGVGLDAGGEGGGDRGQRPGEGDEGIAVSPKMGDALLFWSMGGAMEEDWRALHAGAPVKRGIKVRGRGGVELCGLSSLHLKRIT